MSDEASNQPQVPQPAAAPSAPPAPGAQPYAVPQPQPYTPAQPQQPYVGGYVGQPMPTAPVGPGSGKALAALICGICAIVFSGTVIISIVLGIIALVLASQYVKAFGKDGKATGGKVCGIIGIVFSVLMLVFYLMFGALIFVAASDYANDYSTSGMSLGSTSSLTSSEDIEAAKKVVSTEFDKLKSADQATIDQIATQIDSEFVDGSGFSMAEVGIEPKEFASWLLKDVTYTIADDDVMLSDSEGTVYLDVECRDMMSFMTTFSEDLTAFSSSGGNDTLTSDDAAKAKIGELMRGAMDKTSMNSTFVYVDVVKSGDTWTIDQDSLDSAVEEMYGLF